MSATGIGAAVRRKEDFRFITGKGQYTDDISRPGQTSIYFVRSPHAHARIKSIKLDKAKKAAGVVAVYTGEDLGNAKVGGLPCGWLITDVNGQPMKEPPHPCLAQGKVRYVGDHVAVVVAETQAQARDAAEAVAVDYDVLPAVVDMSEALTGKTVIHDVAPFLGEWYSRGYSRWHRVLLPRIARRALLVMTVSEASRRQIVEHLGVGAVCLCAGCRGRGRSDGGRGARGWACALATGPGARGFCGGGGRLRAWPALDLRVEEPRTGRAVARSGLSSA